MTPQPSSDLDRLLAAGAVAEFASRSGEHFSIRGPVMSGDRRGRTLGFPTANLVPGPDDPCPAVGVYAGSALGRPAAISVGLRPTFGPHDQVRVEVHILDFAGDLYGQPLDVVFLARLRDERRFAGPAELAEQLRLDIEGARRVWAVEQEITAPPATKGERR